MHPFVVLTMFAAREKFEDKMFAGLTSQVNAIKDIGVINITWIHI